MEVFCNSCIGTDTDDMAEFSVVRQQCSLSWTGCHCW